MNTQNLTIPAVVRSITVNAPVERAFSVFTESFSAWWPAAHHINPQGYEAAYIEPRVGGRWFERAPDGTECEWGTVLAWEPPHRVLLTWQLNGEFEYDPDADHASEVEVRFTAEGPSQTRVDLVHGRLERVVSGDKLAAAVGHTDGWNGLLRRYSDLIDGNDLTPIN
jgi:uncharacterized protein YndB with AHSA1/START domain